MKANGAGEHTSEEGEQGETVGRFRATNTLLGTGTFSTVKLGRHDITRRRVALKVLPTKRIAEMGAEVHVSREVRHMRLCSAHPHLAKLYDVFDTPTTKVLAMEYGMGGELLKYMNGRSLSPDEARKFFQQMVGGLEFMHSKGVVHRDLKLENLLLDASKTRIKIVDFGLSNMVTEGELMHTNCGSPRHAAPEIISGKPYVGPPVDIWSSGVILYSMLVGELPFQGKVDAALFRKILSGEFWIPPMLTWGMKELIEGMLCVDPKKRLTMEEIRTKDWYKRDLPHYLCRTPEEIENDERHTVDPSVVEEVLTLYDIHSIEPVKQGEVEEVARAEDMALMVGAEEENERMKDLQVAYRLVMDGMRAKKMYLNSKAPRSNERSQEGHFYEDICNQFWIVSLLTALLAAAVYAALKGSSWGTPASCS